MSKLHDWRRIKPRRTYKAHELSAVLGTWDSTIYGWLKRGLPQVGNGRPALILGAHAIEHIRQLRKSYKRPCAPREMHCLSCRMPRAVAGDYAELIPKTKTSAYLRARCACGRTMFQIVRIDKLKARMPGVVIKVMESNTCE